MRIFEKSGFISARWYKLEEADRRVPTLNPKIVPAIALNRGAPMERIWPSKRRAVVRGAGAPEGDDAAADDPAGDPGVDAEEEEDLPIGGDAGDEAEPEFEALLDPLLDLYEEPLVFAEVPEGIVEAETADGAIPLEAPAPAVEPPPLPPPLAGPDQQGPKRRRRGPQAPAEVTLATGRICFFANGNFEAQCFMHLDERCTLGKRGGRDRGGSSSDIGEHRPLGFLAAWLSMNHFDTKADHKNKEFLKELMSPARKDFRKAHRTMLATHEGAAALFAEEAAPVAGGDPMTTEPDTIA